MEHWTVSDLNAGLCDVEDVGTPRPATLTTEVEVVTEASYKTVREALERAFHEAGGINYAINFARTSPSAFMQVLAKVLPMEIKQEGEITHRVIHALPPPRYTPHGGATVEGLSCSYEPSEQDVLNYLQGLTSDQRANLMVKAGTLP